MKVCTKCGAEKSLAEFYRRKNRKAGAGYNSECKSCTKEIARKWRESLQAREDVAIPETHLCSHCRQVLPGTSFARNRSKPNGIQSICYGCHRARRYGLAPGEYERRVAQQDGLCAICRQKCQRGGELSVDHDHVTGRVRGLLCQNCNAAIGMFRDDPALLGAAIDYLKKAADGA